MDEGKKKNPKRVRQAHDCRGMLRQIRAFFEDPEVSSLEKAHLWDVLTALRGPDIQSSAMKDATTAVIRHYALGDQSGLAIFHDDDPIYAQYRRRLEIEATHFNRHAGLAFAALDLSWFNSNR